MKNTQQETPTETATQKTVNPSVMSAEGWRMAAARRERMGQPVTALMFRNEAYLIEHPEENWFKVSGFGKR